MPIPKWLMLSRQWLLGVAVVTAGIVLSGPAARQGLAQESSPQRLRVLCYNIHHGEGTDGNVNLPRLAEVIKAARPDLVALQEVDNQTARTGRVDQTATLARLTGLHARFARQIDYQGGEYGQTLLSRYPIGEVTVHLLPGEPEREQRIVATATVELPAGPITFATTHLHHRSPEFRLRQVRKINQLFAGIDGPSILAGDFNAVPDSPPIAELTDHWTSTTAAATDPRLTFPAGQPNRQLDYIVYRPASQWRVVQTEVLDEPVASDHRPLLVDLSY